MNLSRLVRKASLRRQICLLRAVFASRYHADVAIDYDCLGPLSSSGWEQTPPWASAPPPPSCFWYSLLKPTIAAVWCVSSSCCCASALRERVCCNTGKASAQPLQPPPRVCFDSVLSRAPTLESEPTFLPTITFSGECRDAGWPEEHSSSCPGKWPNRRASARNPGSVGGLCCEKWSACHFQLFLALPYRFCS